MLTLLDFPFLGSHRLRVVSVGPTAYTHAEASVCSGYLCLLYSRHPLLGPGNTAESCQPRTSMGGVKTVASALALSVVLKVACSELGPFVSPPVFEGLGGVDRAGSSLPVQI